MSHIDEHTKAVLLIAKESCTNQFSENIRLIKRFVSTEDMKNNLGFDKYKKIECLKNREFISVDELSLYIYRNQNNLNWIDFILFYTSDNETIIIVELIECKNSKELNFHCCIMTPHRFVEDQNKKFDINWVLDADMQ